MKTLLITFAGAFVVTFAFLGAYNAGRATAPVIRDAAEQTYREITQQDEVERLKAELEAERKARQELEARPPQVVYDAPGLAL